MFKVLINLYIHRGIGFSSEDIGLQRKVELPFVPYKGLYISVQLKDRKQGMEDIHIDTVTWDTEKQLFRVTIEPDRTLQFESLSRNREPDLWELYEVAKSYIDLGWEVDPDYVERFEQAWQDMERKIEEGLLR